MTDVPSKLDAPAIHKRSEQLTENPHLRQEAERVHETLRIVAGIRDCPSLDEVTATLALLTALLDHQPEVEQTADNGGIMLRRTPGGGSYSVFVRAASIHQLALPLLRKP